MKTAKNEKKTFFSECIKSAFVAADTVSLEFIWSGPAPRAGQFFIIKPRRTTVFLGRPISVAGWEPREINADFSERRKNDRRQNKDRRVRTNWNIFSNKRNTERRRIIERRLGERMDATGILQFLIARRGRGSGELVDMRQGEQAELIGPLGNTWAGINIQEGPIALVGGGIGIAPLMLYARELGSKPFDFYAGFRAGSFGLEGIKARSLVISSEEGTQGLKGRILDFFTPYGYSGVFACGPEPMLKAIGDTCIADNIPCYLSMERHMACGVGACLGCTVKTTQGNKRCCADGPIFRAEEVCFDT